MLGLTDFRHQRVLIFGLGVLGGGESVARWCAQQGANVRLTDLRTAAALAPTLHGLRSYRFRRTLGRHVAADIRWADLIIKNPAVPDRHPLIQLARKLQKRVENETSLFMSLCPSPVLGISGTKGKSSTAAFADTLIHGYLPGTTYGGNYGTPAMALLAHCRPGAPAILEFSSWQLEGLIPHHVSPHVALLTNILPDHLNRYPSFSAYAKTKRSIAAFQQPGDVLILNADNHECQKASARPGVRLLRFSTRIKVNAYVQSGSLMLREGVRAIRLGRVSRLPIRGTHLVADLLAAVLAARSFGVPVPVIQRQLRKLRPLPGRLETVRIRRRVEWINDTTATAPEAVRAALQLYPRGQTFLIAGGVDKSLPYGALAEDIRRRVRAVFLLPGTASDKLAKQLRGWRGLHPVETLGQAVRQAEQEARPGDHVLLSPAAASFNLFRNEFDRGEQFRSLVESL